MKIVMDIPESIAADFTRDRFEDFFQRVLADMNQGRVCGNYERDCRSINIFVQNCFCLSMIPQISI